jgi:hypothetical protein
LRNLREMADLHRQLVRVLGAVQLSQLSHLLEEPSVSTSNDKHVMPLGGAPSGALNHERTSTSTSPSHYSSRTLVASLIAAVTAGRQGGTDLVSVVTARPQPSSRVQGALRKALAAGWADQVLMLA